MKDSRDWSPKQICDEALSLYEGEPRNLPTGLLIIALWNQDSRYDTKFFNCGMSCSEMVSLLEVQKQRIIKYMEADSHD